MPKPISKQTHVPGPSDLFSTPAYVVDALVPLIPRHVETIWEPAAGRGLMVQALRTWQYSVISGDIVNGQDFFESATPQEAQAIITNPPYSRKDAWLQRCYQIGLPFALLLPIEALGAQERQKMFRQWGISVLMLGKRVNFITPSGKGSGAWFEVAWFVWGMELEPNIIRFTEMSPHE